MQSCILAEYLLTVQFMNLASIADALDLHPNDIPLLLVSQASYHHHHHDLQHNRHLDLYLLNHHHLHPNDIPLLLVSQAALSPPL